MSANIDTYMGRQSAWHKAGLVTGQFMTADEILANPGFQYDVTKERLCDPWGEPIDSFGTFRWNRTNGSTPTFLANVGEDYSVIHHSVGFQMSDALVGSINGAHYETAGVLGKGEKVWGLINLAQTLHVGDDQIKTYLAFLTGYDGSVSHQYRQTNVRIVCQNTWNQALAAGAKGVLTLRHTKNAQKRLADMEKALSAIQGQNLSLQDKLNFLATRMVKREALDAIMERLFPKQKAKDNPEETRDTTRRDNIIGAILDRYEYNDGNVFPEQRGTFYNLFNAVTEYTDHVSGAKPDSVLFGSADKRKSEAFDAMVFMAEMAAAKEREVVYVPLAR
jgi:phage/plasmid-like protein (TIGR03299 family)